MASGSRMMRSDSRESVLSISSCVSGVGGWQIGDRAKIAERYGTIAFIGVTKFAPGEWIGLALDEPQGKNDGAVSGNRYFTCPANHGLFCKSSKLERVASSSLTPSRYKSPTPGPIIESSRHAEEYGFDIGDRVVASGKNGQLRFLDETSFAQGVWAGVELDQPLGKNDGSVQGKRYFACKPLYGIFAPAAKVQRCDVQTPNKILAHHTKSSRLRHQMGRGLGGSRESLSSIGRSSVVSSRFGVMRKPMTRHVPTSGNDPMTNLQDALQEKQRHVEQLIAERDIERNEIADLAKRCEELEQRLASEGSNSNQNMGDTVNELMSERRQLKQELMEKTKQIEDINFKFEEEICDKESEIDELRSKLDVTEKETVSLRNQPSLSAVPAKQENSDDKLRIEALQQEISELQKLHSEEKAAWNDKTLAADVEWKTCVEKLEKDIKDNETKYSMDLEKVNGDLQTTLADLENVRKELIQEKQAVVTARHSLDTAETEYKQSLSKLESEHVAELDRQKKEAAQAITSSHDDVAAKLHAQLAEKADELKLSKSEVATAEQTKQKLDAKLSAIEEELKAKDSEVTNQKFELDELRKQLDTAKTRIASEQSSGSERSNEIATLSEKLQALQVSSADDKSRLEKELAASVSALELANTAHQSTVADLQTKLSSLEQALATSQTECEALKVKLAASGDNVGETVKELESVRAQMCLLTEEVDKEKSENCKILKQLEELQTERASVQSALLATKTSLSETKTHVEELEARLTASDTASAEKENQLAEVRSELSTASKEKEKQHEEKVELEMKLRQTHDALEALQASMESFKMGESTMAHDLREAKENAAGKTAELENAHKKIEELASIIATRERGALEADKEKTALVTAKTEVETERNDLVKKLKTLESSLESEMTSRSKMETEVVAKTTELSGLAATIEGLNGALSEKADASRVLTENLTAKQTEVDNVQKEMEVIKQSLVVSEKDKEDLAVQLAAARKQIDVITTKSASEKDSLSAQLSEEKCSLEKRLTELQDETKKITETLTLTENRLKSVSDEKEAVRQTGEKTIKYLEDELKRLQIDLDETKEKLKISEEGEETTKQTMLAQLKELELARVAAIDISNNTRKEHQIRLETEKATLLEDLKKREDVEAALKAALELEKENVGKKDLKVLDLEKSIGEKETTLNTLELQLAALHEEKASLSTTQEQEVVKLRAALERLTQEKEVAQGEKSNRVSELEKNVEEKETIVKTLELELAALKKEKESVSSTQEQELEKLRAELERLKQEKEVSLGEKNDQMADEFAEAMESVRRVAEQKKELEKTIADNQSELLSLRAQQAEADAKTSEARMKLELFDELETDMRKKNQKLVDQVADLEDQLTVARNMSKNEQINTLELEVNFLRSIVADQQKKEAELKKDIQLLSNPPEIDLSFGLASLHKTVKPRDYCDICEEFDLHDTGDCPKQAMEAAEMAAHSHYSPDGKKAKPPPREYCDRCEEFGHDTAKCPKGAMKYTF